MDSSIGYVCRSSLLFIYLFIYYPFYFYCHIFLFIIHLLCLLTLPRPVYGFIRLVFPSEECMVRAEHMRMCTYL